MLCLWLFLTSLPAAPLPAGTLWPLPAADDAVIGASATVSVDTDDTLHTLARRFDMGVWEMQIANAGVDPWLPQAGTGVVVPGREVLPDAPRTGIVINLADMRLYHFQSGGIRAYPVGIGQQGWATPPGRFTIIARHENPWWIPPDSIRRKREKQGRPLAEAYPPGPDNPLGAHALRLNRSRYLIHGTNKPTGVGLPVSHGCVRMYAADIAELFVDVPVGEQVTIVNQAVKAGWLNDRLFLEVHRQPPESEMALLLAATTAPAAPLSVPVAGGPQGRAGLPNGQPNSEDTVASDAGGDGNGLKPVSWTDSIHAAGLRKDVRDIIAKAIHARRTDNPGVDIYVSQAAVERVLVLSNGVPAAIAVASGAPVRVE